MATSHPRHIRSGFAMELDTIPSDLATSNLLISRHADESNKDKQKVIAVATLSKHYILKPIKMMSDSSGDGLSDLDDIDDLEMIMQEVQSEQEQEAAERVRHQNYIYRERLDAKECLMADYFGLNPKCLVRPDATGLPGFSVVMKCTSAIRQLAYGVTPNALDEYLQMGNHCARDCLDFFTMCVIQLFLPEYLRKPDFNDIQNLYTANNNIHGFPGMLKSIDCMHWEWRNCLKSWHGQFASGDKKHQTIMLEAVASYDLWIWHAFFGVAGANNDLTVLNNSSLFDDFFDDITPVAPFECNGITFEKGYLLADGIYPQWSSFVKSLRLQIQRRMHYLNGNKKVLEKTLKELLGSFKDVGIL
ncbi:transcription elongation factor SPT6 [Tanacetum coccineum]